MPNRAQAGVMAKHGPIRCSSSMFFPAYAFTPESPDPRYRPGGQFCPFKDTDEGGDADGTDDL